MLELARSLLAHELDSLEQLSEVQGLSGLDNVNVLVKLVLVPLVVQSSEISGQVDSSTVCSSAQAHRQRRDATDRLFG